jgi:thioredoxin-like negative regulator of GroEL
MARIIECRTDADYQAAIGNSGSALLLIEFCASWTPPSQVVSTEVGKLRLTYPDIFHLVVDFDVCPVSFMQEVFQKYKVSILPTVKLVKSGFEVAEVRGASMFKLRQLIEENY